MAPLILILASFIVLYLINRFFLKWRLKTSFMGRAALAFMLLFTGIAHFTRTESMIAMLPDIVPYKEMVVYATGIFELAAVIGLLTEKISRLTSVLLIVFFIAVLPANIIGSIKEVDLGGMQNGPLYLLFRVPLQIFFIGWTYYHGIRNL